MDGKFDPSIPPLPDGSVNGNPSEISFLELIREDYSTHESHFLPGFLILALHRFGNWRMGIRIRLFRLPFSLLYKVLFPIFTIWFGIKLSYTVRVGRRVKIEHFGGMILGAREIGHDVTIRQNTTFGIATKSRLNGKPVIGDRVEIGTGAIILGNVTVGHDSVIGANAVVISDIPPFSLAVGIPAKVVKRLDNQEAHHAKNFKLVDQIYLVNESNG
jgi:serine O-acetyltransferase